MSTKKVLSIVLVVTIMMLVVGVAPRFTSTASALPLAQSDATIPYSGSLTNEAGRPVDDGAYDFTFALFVAESEGESTWSEAQESVAVQDGSFSVLLGSVNPLPKAALEGSIRWLEVNVRGPGEAEFTLLSPRLELSAAQTPASPSAASSCAHTHLYEQWKGNYAHAALDIQNWGAGSGINAYAHDSTASAVDAWTDSSGNGVEGYSTSGNGVYGWSTDGIGVKADSGGSGRAGPALYAINDFGTHGMAAVFYNASDYHTAHLQNGENGGVLYLQNNGEANGAGGGDFITAISKPSVNDFQFRVTSNGGVLTDAGFRCGDGAPGCLQTGGADVAERVNASEALAPGDVVEIDPTRPDTFRLARTPYSTLIAGVISSDPAILMGVEGISLAETDGDNPDERPPLALVGRVLVRVSAENGAIHIGDLLVASATPGHAMRGDNPPPGTILGKALEPLDSGSGTILALITLH